MFQNRRLSPWLYLLPLVVTLSCASPRAPTGGEVDEDPPVLVPEESTPNQQTNFKDKEIIITFDEWFTLNDVLSQLVISPIMPEDPEVKQKGKSIYITLPDSLKEETTYTINFGSAIADLNEGNVLENYAFVFSTGDILDSVALGGTILDAITLKPAPDVLVMLHDASEDSAVYNIKPEYVARTDEEGKWHLSNIRSDSFQVLALLDGNLNFLYDLETEYFGWYDEVLVTDVPKILLPDIFVFPKKRNPAILDLIHDTPGWIKVVTDGPPALAIPGFLPALPEPVYVIEGDTVHFWYSPDYDYQGHVVFGEDTMKVMQVRDQKGPKRDLSIKNVSGKMMTGMVGRLYSTIPIGIVDTTKIELIADSLERIPFSIESDSLDPRILLLKAAWKPNTDHTLTALPGAMEDVLGARNDTIHLTIQVVDIDAFGDLTVRVHGLEAEHHYIMKLLSGEKQITENLIMDVTDTAFVYNRLMPGKYQVELIEDLNGNGYWDTGDFDVRKQPEHKMLFELESLRAAWEVESTITWK